MQRQANNKKNILFILPSLKRSGAEMQVVDLLRGFDRESFNIHLFTFDFDQSLKEKLEDDLLNHINHPRKYKFDLSMIPQIAKVIDENNIDLIHTSLQIALLFGWLGRRMSKLKPPIINALHKMVGRNKKEILLERFLYQWPMRACAKIICVCRSQKEFWQESFPYIKSKSEVVYNGVDTNCFEKNTFVESGAKLRKEHHIPIDSPVIACVAAFRVEKNHSGLLKSFSELSLSHSRPYLALAGDGPERASIEQLASQLGLESRLVFLGNLSDVRPLLATADLTVLASTAIETFSIAMLESMSMCCPVVSADIGGHREAIEPGIHGDVVPVGDMEALTLSFSRLLSSPDNLKKMGRNARQTVLDSFSLKKMVNDSEKIVNAVIREQESRNKI